MLIHYTRLHHNIQPALINYGHVFSLNFHQNYILIRLFIRVLFCTPFLALFLPHALIILIKTDSNGFFPVVVSLVRINAGHTIHHLDYSRYLHRRFHQEGSSWKSLESRTHLVWRKRLGRTGCRLWFFYGRRECTLSFIWRQVTRGDSQFSGHTVIPLLARDMVDPSQFDLMVTWSFVSVFYSANSLR